MELEIAIGAEAFATAAALLDLLLTGRTAGTALDRGFHLNLAHHFCSRYSLA
jgi:hypothetical protein